MRRSSLYFAAGTLAMLVAGIYSCKKVNGINNNQVVQTPYSLYFADTSGAVYNTNNGKDINPTLFRADGKPTRAIVVSADNVLFAKNNMYISTNNGVNFNHSLDSLLMMPASGCSGDTLELNQSMVLDVPEANRLYSVSNVAYPTAGNYLGLIFNDAHGLRGHWHFDGTYDTTGDMGILPIAASSITKMPNGIIAALAYDINPGIAIYNDTAVIRNIWAINDAGYYRWHEKTGNPLPLLYPNIGGLDRSGTPLPSTLTGQTPGYFSLGHFNNRLIAIDHKCLYGAFYSDDTGKTWIQMTGLPANTGMLCIESPFEQVSLIGTHGKGLYIYNTHTNSWEQNNRGLGTNLIVRSIAAKQNIYKNGTIQKYIYLATNQGIYQSTDNGLNWTKTIPGNFVSVY
jgi:hypothetical protein